MKTYSLKFLLFLLITLFISGVARAEYGNRLELGAGFVTMSNPSTVDFEIGVEYENRVDAMLGAGGSANYIFTSPGTTLLAIPEGFLHPFGGDFLLSGAPLLEFGSFTGTHLGAKIGTRIPLPMGALTLIPEVSLDMINGSNILVFGLGIQF